MNVLLVHSNLELGGAEKHVVELAKGLQQAGIRVVVATHDGYYKARLAQKDITFYHLPVFKNVCTRRKYFLGYIHAFLSLLRIIIKEQIDIVHCHARYVAPISRLAAVLMRKRYVMTVHNCFEGYKRLSVWGKNIIAVSEAVQRHLQVYFGLESQTITVIRNGIMTLRQASEEEVRYFRSELGLTPEHIILACVGRLEAWKGHQYLLEAMSTIICHHPGVMLLIVGDGSLRQQLERQVQVLGLAKHVLFLGARSDVATIITTSTLVVIPSTMEGLPLLALEASSLGQVCVATDVGGISEIVEHQSTGFLVPPRDSQALADAVVFAIEHPEEMRRMGENAQRAFFEKFTLERMVKETIAVYQNLV